MSFFDLDQRTQTALLVAAIVLGGGCGGSPEGEPLPAAYLAQYEHVEQCTGISAHPPRLYIADSRPCPTSGRPCCLADVEPFPCPGSLGPLDQNGDGAPDLCGAGGEYQDGVMVVPRGCDEAVAHVLDQKNDDPDSNHRSPLFGQCQGVTLRRQLGYAESP